MTNPFQQEASRRDDRENFDLRYQYGRAGELEIAKRLRAAGYCVLNACEMVHGSGGAPTISTPNAPLISTDYFVWRGETSRWIEVKRKAAFAWSLKGRCWVTGINVHQYNDYQAIEKNSPWPVWLLILHGGGPAKDSPYPDSPAGLFGKKLSDLVTCEHHRAPQWGMSGLVYWAIDVLEPLDREAIDSLKRWKLGRYAEPIRAVEPESPQRDPEQLRLEGF